MDPPSPVPIRPCDAICRAVLKRAIRRLFSSCLPFPMPPRPKLQTTGESDGSVTTTETPETTLDALEAVQSRVLWLATSIIHHANRVRPTGSGVKVGGHQASSASMVSI